MQNKDSIRKSRRKFIQQAAITIPALSIIPTEVFSKRFIAPSDKIHLGFIGLGKQSRGLSNQFIERPGTHIVAACDVWIPKLRWFRDHVETKYAEERNEASYRSVSLYDDYRHLLQRSDIDAVVIATPDHWHAIQAIDAMEAGKDVYCEKPLTHTIEEGIQMVKAAQKTGKIVQTGSMQRSWSDFRHACELVINGYIGKVEKVLVNVGDPARPYDLPEEPMPEGLNWDRWCGPATVGNYNHRLAPQNNDVDFWPDWRLFKEYGGGILCDWGAHMFDIAQWGLGADDTGPVKLIPPENKSSVRGLKYIYQNGVEMVHEDFDRGWAVRFIGSEGSLDISRDFLDSKPGNIVTAEIKSSEKRLYFSDDHYVDWIESMKNRTQPICPAEVGHRSASICNLGNIAYELGRELAWDPVKQEFKNDSQANKLKTKKYRKKYKL